MQIGIDSFAAAYDEKSRAVSASDRLNGLVEEIEQADQVGLDVFGFEVPIDSTLPVREIAKGILRYQGGNFLGRIAVDVENGF